MLGHQPSLDGLRAVAILPVMVFHAGILPGGWAGVDVFFALSGFLITALLLEEHGRSGTIDLGHFYVRRLLRLLPALLLCVAVIGTALLLLRPDRRAGLGSVLAAVLLYVPNWALVFGLNLGSFAHTWSLGIEEQFYLLWPPLLLLLRRRLPSPTAVALVAAAMAAVSAAYRLNVAWSGPLEPFVARRLFAGLDVRADSLLVGCALAALWYGGVVHRVPRPLLAAAGTLAAGTLLATFATARFVASFFVYGMSTVTAVATALVIAEALRPSSWIARGLQAAPLVAVGRISYALYLWHFPVFDLVGILNFYPNVVAVPPLGGLLAGWLLTFAAAGGSLWLVERPALRLKRRFQPRPGRPVPAPVAAPPVARPRVQA